MGDVIRLDEHRVWLVTDEPYGQQVFDEDSEAILADGALDRHPSAARRSS